MIDLPTEATLKRYGLVEQDFIDHWERQGGVCGICSQVPTPNKKTGKRLLNIDHEHVKNWKKMPPEQRKLYVRGLVCWQCNRFRLFRGATAKIAYNMWKFLQAYENRRDHALGLHESSCTCYNERNGSGE